MRRFIVAAALFLALACASSCNRRVFEEVVSSCNKTIVNSVDVPTEKAADILIVVDSSGSMIEEQTNLVSNFLNQDANECPLQNLADIDPDFKNPVRDLYTNGGPLAECGFIQLLAAFENDFRVGVITTDVGLCDNRIPSAQGGQYCGGAGAGSAECQEADGGGWGFRPQRGCLQPNGPPGTLEKVIAAADLDENGDGNPTNDNQSNDDFAQRFRDTLQNIQIFGSPFERGLDAATLFLGQGAGSPNPDCAGDLGLFRRDNAALVIIFLTDEEDCSHGLGGAFDNEHEGEICGAYDSIVREHNPGDCYANEGALSPVSAYKDALLAADPNLKVAVIAGGLGEPGNVSTDPDGDGVEDGCQIVGGLPAGDCFESGGLSNFTGANQPCDAGDPESHGNQPCCTGDPGTRYFNLAEAIGKKTTDSICNASYRGTMLDIAAFIASVDFLALAEPPTSPNAVLVQLTKAGESDPTTIPHLADNANCATETGWKLEGETRVILCGEARPGPGDNISVAANGTVAIESCLDG